MSRSRCRMRLSSTSDDDVIVTAAYGRLVALP
jgi:hypothetical protein